ncbi:inner membrane protein involved in colicin E2 resistance [Bradyrhizobium huanghuaihaiense]|uniref:Bsl2175 protein n=5 Tax=Bradyrhizobium TaxID=374 RepID=Q89T75_BRADU|nr:hypothetical protein RN69_37265 [Bradyrhizobium japonicum]AND87708.1 hypothetical protein AAV28_07730 [Bradyrhizobium diazoefficiens USDA 110]APO50783.1 hypothetical protein BD122_11010 [Bradyrhizobium diazoefficiens]AWL91226.1 hypothetical protein CIT37_02100 [Bradyrhizobium ottawaense]MCS3899121.1 inner membrane protein involved in colicin E2 resistance [Bradyrhizobium japonicum USDA 38]MCS3932922.1 inner membrane protein involved in colicin E2 resistance [Bradyrhizobium elkanii]TWH93160
MIRYTGQFYSLFLLAKVLRVENLTANYMLIGATIITVPLYVVFVSLSDKIGRRKAYVAVARVCVAAPQLFRRPRSTSVEMRRRTKSRQ